LSVERDTRAVLMLTPFPPRLDGVHGGSRALAELIRGLATHHRIAVLTLKSRDEPGMTPSLAARCESVTELELPAPPATRADAAWQHTRRLLAALRGTPPWAHTLRVAGVAEQLSELARSFRPDVVQVHFSAMAQYLPAVAESPAARVLVIDEPDTLAATERWAAARGPRRLVRRLHLRAWRRYERRALEAVDSAVVLTDADRRLLQRIAPARRSTSSR
jgi:hypothetical protein